MAELSELLEKMNKRQEKQEKVQLDALGSLETSFPQAFAAKAEVLVGEKRLFEHSEQLDSIRRGVAGMSLTFVQRFQDFFTNFAGIMPSRAARKRADAASLATSLMQADIADIAAAMSSGEKRAEIEQREKRRGLFGGLGGVFEDLGKTLGMLKKGVGGKAVEKAREAASYQAKMLGYARVTAEATGELADQEPEKEKKKLPWGMIAIAGIAMVVSFFKEIGQQIKWMKTLIGGGMAKLFAPLKAFFGKGLVVAGDKIISVMDSITGALDSLRDILFKPDSMLGKMMIKIRAGVKTFTTQKWVVGIKDTFVKGFNSSWDMESTD